MAPKVAIVIYSMYGHIATMAEAVKSGIVEAGGDPVILQIEETLPEEVLKKMYAPPKPDYPTISDPKELTQYDAYLFGIPTRYGNFPGQWKAFIDKTGGLWQSGGLYGKYVGVFISTASMGGGQESTALATMSTFAHHGMIYVPFGYAKAFGQMTDLSEIHGGSPWGSGTFAGADGSRQPTDKEKEIAKIQGKTFYETVSKVNFCLDKDHEAAKELAYGAVETTAEAMTTKPNNQKTGTTTAKDDDTDADCCDCCSIS